MAEGVINCTDFGNFSDDGDRVGAEDPSPSGVIHDIRCGLLHAKLHMNRFICPGIHRKCIEFEGTMVTPRQFTIKAEKDKQKDWKGSIRLGRHNLRTLMEMRTLDFHEHAKSCSLKCQSRNYIKNKRLEATSESSTTRVTPENGEGDTDEWPVKRSPQFSLNTIQPDEMNGHLKPAPHTNWSSQGERKTSISSSSSSVLDDYIARTVQPINGNAVLASLNLGIHPTAGGGGHETIHEPCATPPVNSHKNPGGLLTGGIPHSNRAFPPHLLNTGDFISTLPTPEKQLFTQWQMDTNDVTKQEGTTLLATVLQALIAEQQRQQSGGGARTHPHPVAQAQPHMRLNGHANPLFVTSGVVAGSRAQPQNQAAPFGGRVNSASSDFPKGAGEIRRLMELKPVLFWSRMRELGIADELLSTLSTTVDEIKRLYLRGGAEEFTAQKLSQISSLLGLDLLYSDRIYSKYVQIALESKLTSHELQDLQTNLNSEKLARLERAMQNKPNSLNELLRSTSRQQLLSDVVLE